MKRRILSTLLAMTLIVSLAMPTTAATGRAVGSPSNGGGGNGGVEIPTEPEKPQTPVTPPSNNTEQKPVTPPQNETNKKPDTTPTTPAETTPEEVQKPVPSTPAITTPDGEKKPLTVVTTEKQDDNSLLIGGANAGGNSLSVNGATSNGDGTLTLGGGDRITTQEERQSILKEAQTTIMVTQSLLVEQMLDHFTQKETTEETTSKDAIQKLVENGVSVLDAVKTVAMSNVVQNSETVTETLDNLSEEIRPQVQEAAKDSALKLQETTEVKTNATKKALGLLKQLVGSMTEAVDVDTFKEAMAAENPEEAAAFEKILDKLEKKNIIITPEVIEQVIKKQEEHQKVLKEIEEGNVDRMSVHSVIDISVSDDVKEMVKGDGNYVEVPVNMPGIDEDTLVVALKPVQGTDVTLDEEENFQGLQAEVNAGNAKDVLKKLDNQFTIIPCTPYDGGVVLEMPNFSPVMILTYADTTTDVTPLEEEPAEEPAETIVIEPEETEADSNMTMILVIIVVAIIVIGAVVVITKKKSGDKTEK